MRYLEMRRARPRTAKYGAGPVDQSTVLKQIGETMSMVAPTGNADESGAVERFTFDGAEVRTVIRDGDPWWVAGDVCAALCITNVGNALSRLDDDEKSSIRLTDGTPGNPNRAIINEAGLYSLIIRSDRPDARKFKRWITHEVLPAIRKTGQYVPTAVPKEITAAAGPVPYREQAEILSILRPVLPESYAVATGKVILARAMGERPELESSETPLYAATFLAEKGHKPKTVSKFQSGFGSRVSNRYFKVHGRRPDKIAGPAGSRIDKVAVYSEDDRPLLEQVYSEIADLINAFETGGQTELAA